MRGSLLTKEAGTRKRWDSEQGYDWERVRKTTYTIYVGDDCSISEQIPSSLLLAFTAIEEGPLQRW
jgi:hypothetical protein